MNNMTLTRRTVPANLSENDHVYNYLDKKIEEILYITYSLKTFLNIYKTFEIGKVVTNCYPNKFENKYNFKISSENIDYLCRNFLFKNNDSSSYYYLNDKGIFISSIISINVALNKSEETINSNNLDECKQWITVAKNTLGTALSEGINNFSKEQYKNMSYNADPHSKFLSLNKHILMKNKKLNNILNLLLLCVQKNYINIDHPVTDISSEIIFSNKYQVKGIECLECCSSDITKTGISYDLLNRLIKMNLFVLEKNYDGYYIKIGYNGNTFLSSICKDIRNMYTRELKDYLDNYLKNK